MTATAAPLPGTAQLLWLAVYTGKQVGRTWKWGCRSQQLISSSCVCWLIVSVTCLDFKLLHMHHWCIWRSQQHNGFIFKMPPFNPLTSQPPHSINLPIPLLPQSYSLTPPLPLSPTPSFPTPYSPLPHSLTLPLPHSNPSLPHPFHIYWYLLLARWRHGLLTNHWRVTGFVLITTNSSYESHYDHSTKVGRALVFNGLSDAFM